MQSVAHKLDELYTSEPESVSRARSRIAVYAASMGATRAQIDGVRLAVSEAMTNALVHGYRGSPGRIQLSAGVTGRQLWVVIRDAGEGMRPVADRPGLGLGLSLIAQISDHMTIIPRRQGGTELRMRFDLGPDTSSGQAGRDVPAMMLAVAAPSRT
jgi:anti-sigma regulatory factor (Ser/Thr protein kinase)